MFARAIFVSPEAVEETAETRRHPQPLAQSLSSGYSDARPEPLEDLSKFAYEPFNEERVQAWTTQRQDAPAKVNLAPVKGSGRQVVDESGHIRAEFIQNDGAPAPDAFSGETVAHAVNGIDLPPDPNFTIQTPPNNSDHFASRHLIKTSPE